MTQDERLAEAFVQGAQWWEWQVTNATMWASDRAMAYERARELLADGVLGMDPDERIALFHRREAGAQNAPKQES